MSKENQALDIDFDAILDDVTAKKDRSRKGTRLERIYDFMASNPGCTRRDAVKHIFMYENPKGTEGMEAEEVKKQAETYASAVNVALGESQASIKGGPFELTVEEKDGKITLIDRA